MKNLSSCVLAIAALASVSAALSAQLTQQGQLFSPDTLPDRLKMNAFSGQVRMGYQEGRVDFVAAKKRVDFYWTASSLTNQEPDPQTYSSSTDLHTNARGTSKYTRYNSSVATTFYPTAFGRLDEDSFLVAGVTNLGRTIIQRWDMVWPSPMPVPEVDSETGYDSIEIVVPGVQRVTLYNESAFSQPVRRYVSGVCGLRGSSGGTPGKALVQFAQPNDIMELTLATGGMSLLASELNSAASKGTIAALAVKEYSSIAVFNQTQMGYVYFVNTGTPSVSAFYGGAHLTDSDARVHLVDSDRNGTIDGVLQLSTNQARTMHLLDLDYFSAWWLE